jgi:hypothetical protein
MGKPICKSNSNCTHISVDILLYMQKPYYVPMIKNDNMVIHVIRPHCEPLVKLALSQTWDRGIVRTHFERVIMYEVSMENR